jgi:hypothetical protein
VLEAGTMVTGRVLDQGRPLRGISIGICQADRSAGKFLGPYQVDTDEEGKFALANLPSEEDLLAYGIMKSLKGEKALPVRKFRTANGSTTDLGDLMIAPAHSIRGRLALADGQPIPPHTRVMFSREEAWDSSFVEAAADGTFWIGGIPKEIIEVFVGINGYRLSAKNKSFEPLNGSSIKGHVSADVEDLVILYEQGKEIPSDDRNWEAAAEKHERLRTQPLAGVTAALAEFPPEKINAAVPGPRKPLPKIAVPEREPVPASAQNGAPTVTLTGKVVDHQGQQVDKAKLWLPVRWLSPFEWLIAKGSYDAPDPFRLTYPEAWVPTNIMDRNPTVWAYAPKHAIGTRSAHKQLFGKKPAEPFEIALPEAGDLTFVVMLPDGKPAVGAKVQPLHFKTSRGYDHIPRELAELVAGTTDTNGRAALPALTRDGVHTIDVKLAGFGTQQFRCDMKLTDPPEQTLKLRPTGRIEGRIATDQLDLVRGMYVSLETEGLEPDNDLREATGVALLKVDDEGRFVVPEIAAGHVEVFASGDKRLPVRARLPKRGALTLLEKETETIEIPLEMGVRVHGIVRAKDSQKPLAGVTLSVRYGVGIQGDQAVTDEKGEYSTIALAGETYVHLIALPAGYQQLGAPWDERRTVPSDAQEYEWPLIEVVPSTKIFGKLINRDGKPMARVSINGVVGNRRYGSGKTDETGVFTLTDVPEGIQLEKFEIWTRDEHFEGVIETKEPLVVQVKK